MRVVEGLHIKNFIHHALDIVWGEEAYSARKQQKVIFLSDLVVISATSDATWLCIVIGCKNGMHIVIFVMLARHLLILLSKMHTLKLKVNKGSLKYNSLSNAFVA